MNATETTGWVVVAESYGDERTGPCISSVVYDTREEAEGRLAECETYSWGLEHEVRSLAQCERDGIE